mgnify:CR=1 FL=1
MKKLLLIDTFNFLHRAYHALPKSFKDANGEPTNAVYGVSSMLINIFDLIKPDYVIAALDSQKPTFRVESFTAYKAHRKEMDTELAVQIPKIFEIIDSFGVTKIVADGYEADDIIGTAAVKFANEDLQVIVASNDKDLWQLSNENVRVILPNTNGQVEWLDYAEISSRLGFEPINLIDYKALRGDASDNIPGVYGIGEVTAKSLIEKYKTLENIYENINDVKPETLKTKLIENIEIAYTSKSLATIITDAPIELNLEKCKYTQFNRIKVVEQMRKFNFKSLVRRLGFDVEVQKTQNNDDQLKLL